MTKKKIFKLSGMHCTSCSLVVEGELEDQLGVVASANYQKQAVEVEFDPNKISEGKIVAVIEDTGYKVVGKA